MSAALQLTSIWATEVIHQQKPPSRGAELRTNHEVKSHSADQNAGQVPNISLAFYRKHTEKMLRRYLYASMLVGRAPAILGEPIGRGGYQAAK